MASSNTQTARGRVMGPVESNSMAVSRNAAVCGQSTPATSSCMPAPRPPALWYCCARDCAAPVLGTRPQTTKGYAASQFADCVKSCSHKGMLLMTMTLWQAVTHDPKASAHQAPLCLPGIAPERASPRTMTPAPPAEPAHTLSAPRQTLRPTAAARLLACNPPACEAML